MTENQTIIGTHPATICCIDCSVKLPSSSTSPFSLLKFWNHNTKLQYCSRIECHQPLCSTCAGMYPLILDSNPTTNQVQSFCKTCFYQVSTVDFNRTFDVLQPTDMASNTSDIIFVFVHGGAGSRAMFRKHAEILVHKYNHTCLLIDLPGHGSLVHTPLTLDSCVDVVSNLMATKENSFTELEQLWNRKTTKTIVYVGGSLGAYVGFYILNKLLTSTHDPFDGAILLDCGQNVGPGASIKAQLGLMLMNYIGTHKSNKQMMSLMQSIVSKSKADFYLHETSYSSGMFFQQASAQVECLKQVEPAALLPTLNMPILFMNGSEDYRDSENKWLSLCKDQEGSSLKVYIGGDHFFTHDSRFVDDMIERWNEFAQMIHRKKEKH